MARKEKEYHFIYKTTNLKNGKYYVGMHSTDNLNDGYLGSGKRLRRSLKKHGKENFKFEILEFLPNRTSLKEREKEIVNLNEISKKECLNLMIGGHGGLYTEEHLNKVRKIGGQKLAEKIKNDKEFREKRLEDLLNWCKKNHKLGLHKYDNFKDKHHTEESKKKISESKKGRFLGDENSQFGTCWITNEKENKKIHKGGVIPDGWKLGRFINTI